MGGTSRGASGAIYGIVATSALLFPDSKMSLIELPMLPTDSLTAFKAAVCFDTLGALLNWGTLDHWGHLGGAAFGIWYTLHGHKLWVQLRQKTALAEGGGQ